MLGVYLEVIFYGILIISPFILLFRWLIKRLKTRIKERQLLQVQDPQKFKEIIEEENKTALIVLGIIAFGCLMSKH